jgi:hypothetical protein
MWAQPHEAASIYKGTCRTGACTYLFSISLCYHSGVRWNIPVLLDDTMTDAIYTPCLPVSATLSRHISWKL